MSKSVLKGVLLAAALLFAFYVSPPSFAAAATVPKTVAQDKSIPHIQLGGAVFHSETFGDEANPVVIVVHGGPGWDYRSLLPLKALSDEYFIVFYDQRGTGLSPRVDPAEITLETTLSDLDAFVEHYGKGAPVRLIGHSWGGMVVSGYIGRHPEKVSHAVLAEPGFLTTDMMKKSGVRFGPRWEAGFLYRASKEWIRSFFVRDPDKHASSDYFFGQIAPYANPEYYCGGVLPEAALTYWRPGAEAMQSIMKSALNKEGKFEIDLTKGVERFQRPVLFLASSCNRRVGVEYQKEQLRFFPKAELVVIENSGHMVFAERPEESIKAVRGYLAGAPDGK